LSKIPRIEDTLDDIRAANKAGGNYAGQFVVYDLPDRDCAAAASNGEYSIIDGGEEKYKNYINTIRDVLISYSDIRVILVIGECLLEWKMCENIRGASTNTMQSLTLLPTWSPT
jgi:cellulose 1,4-beta-cellobiosidase